MMKFLFVFCAAIALMQQTQAFKVVTIHKAVLAPVPVGPPFDPTPLIQGVQSAVAGKLQLVQTLVGSLIQKKLALKQNALNSIQSTLGGVKSQVGTLAGSIHPPFVIRKHIYVGYPKLALVPAPVAPDSTTSVDVDATTSE